MKPIALSLALTIAAAAGCITLPTDGDGPTGRGAMPAAELAPPPPVTADGITEKNARDVLQQLEDEVRFDERSAEKPATLDGNDE